MNELIARAHLCLEHRCKDCDWPRPRTNEEMIYCKEELLKELLKEREKYVHNR